MKIIDLLNKIANGEEVPEKFKFAGQTFEKQGSYIEDEDGDSIFDSMCTDFSNINEEVEIIEEEKKIPEKLGYFDLTKDEVEKDEYGNKLELHYTGVADTFDDVYNKINEILDYLKSKGE